MKVNAINFVNVQACQSFFLFYTKDRKNNDNEDLHQNQIFLHVQSIKIYTVISTNLLLWKFLGNAYFPQSFENLRKLCVSVKFPHQKIRWNFGILRSDFYRNGIYLEDVYIFLQKPSSFLKIFHIPALKPCMDRYWSRIGLQILEAETVCI